MELLYFYFVTCITSYFMDLTNGLRVFKDVADAGYKIDIRRFSELQKQLNPDAVNISFLSFLIPVYNILQVSKRIMQYNSIRPMILDQLSAIDCLEEMTEFEKKEYLKKPTLLNAVIVPIKFETKLANASTMEFKNCDVNGEIIYEWNNKESFDDITILKTTGEISKLSEDLQKEKIIEGFRYIYQQGIKKYGSIDGIIDTIRKNSNLNFATDEVKVEEENKQELSNREKIEKLESLKNEIYSQQKMQNNKNNLTKKRKLR